MIFKGSSNFPEKWGPGVSRIVWHHQDIFWEGGGTRKASTLGVVWIFTSCGCKNGQEETLLSQFGRRIIAVQQVCRTHTLWSSCLCSHSYQRCHHPGVVLLRASLLPLHWCKCFTIVTGHWMLITTLYVWWVPIPKWAHGEKSWTCWDSNPRPFKYPLQLSETLS